MNSDTKIYDLIIIGGGPAGLAAGLYASRARLSTLLLERTSAGGWLLVTAEIENYPGVGKVGGYDLVQKMEASAKEFGCEFKYGEVSSIEKKDGIYLITAGKNTYESKTVLLASGTKFRHLEVPGEEKFKGKGVSFCATCDAAFYRNLEVAVVGGGDTALEEAIFLTKFVSKVYLVHRRNQFRATKLIQERLLANDKIEPIYDSVVREICGDLTVEKIVLENVKTGEEKDLSVSGIFIFIGQLPNTEFVKDLVKLDKQNFIITDQDMNTSQPGIFAAGDVRHKLLRQVVTAAGDGATAAFAVEKYLEALSEN